MGVAVGIDLGTTNSCVSVVQGDKARVVENERGRRVQPSIISFHPDGSVLAGEAAKDRLIVDPVNTIYSFKRLLGRELSSAEMQTIIKDFPYEVEEGPDDVPVVKARGRTVSLPEISAMMLKHLREMCADTLGVEIGEAVITVPANFNDVQRSSTKVAGRIAGFNVLRILNEPTAAALAYGFGGQKTERIAVYDFGGGTFDITIIELMDDIFEVLSTAGDTFLGGDDFDDKIVEEMRGRFLREHRCDLGEDPTAMQRVRSVAERIKCQLSTLEEVEATLREIAYGPGGTAIDFSFKMTRGHFEELIDPLVDNSLRTCEEALKLAGMDVGALDNLILVGGSTRVPLVRRKVEQYFGKRPRTEINPDEVVAIGAAIHAFSLTGESLPEHLPRPVPKAPVINAGGMRDAVRMSRIPAAAGPAPAPMIHAPSGGSAKPAAPDRKPQRTIMGLPSPFKKEEPSGLPAPLQGLAGAPPLDDTEELLDDDLLEELPEDTATAATVMMPAAKPPAPLVEPEPELIPEPEPFGALDPESFLEPEPSVPQDLVGGMEAGDFFMNNADDHFEAPTVKPSAASTLLLDVTPRALGVGTAGGYCDQIIERNAAIPVEQGRLFSTSTDNQTEVVIDIFQGESRRVEQNAKLGQVQLSGIRPAPRGEIKIRVVFEIDTDGILGVSAVNEETGQAQETRILLSGGLTEDKVQALVEKYSSP